jgi:hypothetical protein
MNNNIYFKFIEDMNTHNIYMDWCGTYTAGYVSCRGTRLWLHSDSGHIITTSYDSTNMTIPPSNPDKCDIFEYFGWDDQNIRCENIDELIKIIDCSDNMYRKVTKNTDIFQNIIKNRHEKSYGSFGMDISEYNSLVENFRLYFNDYIKQINNDTFNGILLMGSTDIIIINKQKEIIDELLYVEETGYENNVTFEWI